MKTGVFENLYYKIITKKNYYGSCPDIHFISMFVICFCDQLQSFIEEKKEWLKHVDSLSVHSLFEILLPLYKIQVIKIEKIMLSMCINFNFNSGIAKNKELNTN